MLEKVVNIVYISGGLVLLMTVIMAISSCGSTKEIKKCCEKTVNEVYKYEKEYIK